MFEVAGSVRFGDADGVAGTPTFLFNENQATELAQRGNVYDSISVVADEGVSQKEVVEKIETAFAKSDVKIEAVTGEQITKENQNTIKEGLSFFNIALSAFAAIAFVVAIVIIINSFAMTWPKDKENMLYCALLALRLHKFEIQLCRNL